MIEIKEKNDVAPLCPHCSEAVKEIWFRQIKGMLVRRYVYFESKLLSLRLYLSNGWGEYIYNTFFICTIIEYK